MPFTLKLLFTGLIAFVPIKDGQVVYDVTPENQPDHVWVLLVDARDPSPAHDRVGDPFPPHLPEIRYEESYRLGGRPPSAKSCSKGPFQSCKPIPLHEETLTLIYDEPPKNLSFHTPHPDRTRLTTVSGTRKPGSPLPCCTLSTDPTCAHETDPDRLCLGHPVPGASLQMQDYTWLAGLSEIVPGVLLDPDSWASHPKHGRIVTRLKLDRGTLITHILQHNEKDTEPANEAENFSKSETVVFDPQTMSTRWSRRALAKKMALEVPGLKDSIRIRSHNLDSDNPFAPPHDLILGPPADCPSPCVVTVELSNSPSDHGDAGTSKLHFELFWNLATNPPSPRPSPVLAVTSPPNTDLLCPEVRP